MLEVKGNIVWGQGTCWNKHSHKQFWINGATWGLYNIFVYDRVFKILWKILRGPDILIDFWGAYLQI